jgi:Peptidase family M23
MSRIICLSLISLLFHSLLISQSQPPEANELEVYDEKIGDLAVGFFADNTAEAPITVTIEFHEKKNITLPVKLPYTVVVPAKSKHFKIMEVGIIKGKAVSFQYGYGMVLGDVLTAKHEDSHIYQLPFEPNKAFQVGQGYNGRFSHQGTNAIDFDMVVGTKVCAAREGIVIFTKQDGKKSCKQESCAHEGNYIIVLHSDGSFGRYVHLNHKGVCVERGQKVKAGQVIGYSGNTGWSSGPHLHFEVFVPVPNGYITVATKFKTANGSAVYLEEEKTYKK